MGTQPLGVSRQPLAVGTQPSPLGVELLSNRGRENLFFGEILSVCAHSFSLQSLCLPVVLPKTKCMMAINQWTLFGFEQTQTPQHTVER